MSSFLRSIGLLVRWGAILLWLPAAFLTDILLMMIEGFSPLRGPYSTCLALIISHVIVTCSAAAIYREGSAAATAAASHFEDFTSSSALLNFELSLSFSIQSAMIVAARSYVALTAALIVLLCRLALMAIHIASQFPVCLLGLVSIIIHASLM